MELGLDFRTLPWCGVYKRKWATCITSTSRKRNFRKEVYNIRL